MFQKLSFIIDDYLYQPRKILFTGFLLVLFLLVFDGSLWRFWSLYRGQEDIIQRTHELEARAQKLEFEIHQAAQLTYIERQATDQFDYVREGDLIFVFSE